MFSPDYTDYLSVPEIDLELWIQSNFQVKETVLTASANAFVNSGATPVINYLLATLPIFLNKKYGIRYNTSLQEKLIGTVEKYNSFLAPFLETIESYGYENTDQLSTLLSFTKIPFKNTTWMQLCKSIYICRKAIKTDIAAPSWNLLRTLFSIFATEEINTDTISSVIKEHTFILNKLLGRYIASINLDKEETDSATELKEARKSVDAITKKYCKTANPDAETLKQFQEKYPEKYKEYRKAVNLVKKAQKKVVAEAFADRGYTIVTTDIAKKLLKDIGIPDPIDDNFIGKVGIGSTPAMLFTYYTSSGKQLDAVVGKQVKMNPKYTEDGDEYYCTHMPFISKKGVPVKVYTVNHRNDSGKKLFNLLRENLAVLEDVRFDFSAKVKPLMNGSFDDQIALSALVLKVIDETAGRIGNAASVEENETFGIHNLQVRHARISSRGCTLKYIGKKQVPQEHKVTDPVSIACIKKLIEGRKKKEYIFSKDGEKPVSPSAIAAYLKSTGFTASPHMFRKIWAAKIFNTEGLKKLPKAKIKSEKQAKELFNSAVQAVANKLGQTEKNTSIRSYIDPTLMKAFWDRAGYKMPKPVQRAYDRVASQTDSEDED